MAGPWDNSQIKAEMDKFATQLGFVDLPKQELFRLWFESVAAQVQREDEGPGASFVNASDYKIHRASYTGRYLGNKLRRLAEEIRHEIGKDAGLPAAPAEAPCVVACLVAAPQVATPLENPVPMQFVPL